VLAAHTAYPANSAYPIMNNWPAALRKAVFQAVKGGLLACKRPSFASQKATFCSTGYNALIFNNIQIALQSVFTQQDICL
jgi:hypothetical protein